MSLKLDYERAITHLMIAKGSVALPIGSDRVSNWQDEQRGYSCGSYYGSEIEADVQATIKFYDRLAAGARPIYEECGPSDFGQEDRFNGTFTSSQLTVHYSFMPVVLDDDPTPVKLIAAVEPESSFVSTLKMLLTQDLDSVDSALEILKERVDRQQLDKYSYKLSYPKL